MDLITSRLDLQFGSFPEPVIFLAGGQAVYSNEPGQQLLQSEIREKAPFFQRGLSDAGVPV